MTEQKAYAEEQKAVAGALVESSKAVEEMMRYLNSRSRR